MTMKAKYHISKKDYVASGRLYARPTVKVVIVSVMVFAVLLVVAVYAPPAVSAPIVGGLIGWIVFFLAVQFFVSPYLLGRHYDKYKAMHEEFTVELREEGVSFSSRDGEGLLRWDAIHKWRQNDRYVIIFSMPRLYYVVPKSISESGFDIPALVAALNQTMPESK
ncbi:hypothetical protein ASALC70_01845 [Alcanivorax sp. ALC70]|nr:hypothetical protein [Alcanivorax sp.]MAY09256.1 hypothetical protein [Alcanivorax sp.]MBI56502.1 hypothetical protein [Alcanivorax sp.]UWN49632.1 hypothetical protein ASALC70_01845 [Alcanivorax sp. ALC70]